MGASLLAVMDALARRFALASMLAEDERRKRDWKAGAIDVEFRDVTPAPAWGYEAVVTVPPETTAE